MMLPLFRGYPESQKLGLFPLPYRFGSDFDKGMGPVSFSFFFDPLNVSNKGSFVFPTRADSAMPWLVVCSFQGGVKTFPGGVHGCWGYSEFVSFMLV